MHVEREVTICNRLGLHLRAAGRLVDAARRFHADIRVRKGQKEVDCKSIMEVMTLGATSGTPITLLAKGKDATRAVECLEHLVKRKFDEE